LNLELLMKVFAHEFDATNLVEKAIAQVRGKSFQDAIVQLAFMGSSPNVDHLRQEVMEAIKNYPLSFLFEEKLYNENGKYIARKPSIMSNHAEESETAIQVSMLKCARLKQHLHASTIINSARYQINMEHNASIEDFSFIVANNPVIPPGREIIYARGLLEGLKGDLLISTHLLIPQLENSIRYLMEQNGYIVSGLNDQGFQNEHNINTLIYRPELVEILGEDIVFDLKGLLVNRFSSNLRNRMAHGLVSYHDFFSDPNSYLWWLTLRLCCLPITKIN